MAQRIHVLISGMLAGKTACARFAFEWMVIISVHMLIASLLTPKGLGACIALEGGGPVIEGIHMLCTCPPTCEGTGTGIALIHIGRARTVVELLL